MAGFDDYGVTGSGGYSNIPSEQLGGSLKDTNTGVKITGVDKVLSRLAAGILEAEQANLACIQYAMQEVRSEARAMLREQIYDRSTTLSGNDRDGQLSGELYNDFSTDVLQISSSAAMGSVTNFAIHNKRFYGEILDQGNSQFAVKYEGYEFMQAAIDNAWPRILEKYEQAYLSGGGGEFRLFGLSGELTASGE